MGVSAGTPTYFTTSASNSVGLWNYIYFEAHRHFIANDLAVSVFGENRVVRQVPGNYITGQVYNYGPIYLSKSATNPITARTGQISYSQNAPMGAMSAAPYQQQANDISLTAACLPTGTTPPTGYTAGNWYCAQINSYYKHCMKYDQGGNQAIYQDLWNNLQSYGGAVTGYTGQPILNGFLQPMTAGSKPSLIGYEGSPQAPVPVSVYTGNDTHATPIPGYTGNPGLYDNLTRDCFYHPSWVDVHEAYCRMAQDGLPGTPKSGFAFDCFYGYTWGWGGARAVFLFNIALWGGQLPGPGTGLTNTSAATGYTGGATPVNQQFATAQGGSPADGNVHSYTNDSVGAYQMLNWFAVTN
jgi:hypothetical protein